jgi:hypothetical protein
VSVDAPVPFVAAVDGEEAEPSVPLDSLAGGGEVLVVVVVWSDAGEDVGFVDAAVLEPAPSLVLEAPDGGGVVVALPGSDGALAVVEVPPEVGVAPMAEGLDAAPLPGAPAAVGGVIAPVPAVVEGPEVALEVAPAEVAGVLDGGSAGLPRGVAVTVGGTPVAVPPGRAALCVAFSGTTDTSCRWWAFAVAGPAWGSSLSL